MSGTGAPQLEGKNAEARQRSHRRSIPTKSLGSWDRRHLLHVQAGSKGVPRMTASFTGADVDHIHTSRNVVKNEIVQDLLFPVITGLDPVISRDQVRP